MKICCTCKIEKDLSNFNKDKNKKDGLQLACKACQKEYKKIYYKNNKEKINLRNKDWKNNNKEKIIENSKEYYQENIEKIKKYKKDNKERIKDYNKEYRNNNKELIILKDKEYKKNNKEKRNKQRILRKQSDPLFKLNHNIRSLIRDSIKRKGYKKNSKTKLILGCSFEEFKLYLESKFESWMNWNNHGNPKDGILELNKSWDIDHIIPLASAKTEEELLKLNHYTNLQPLCSYTNRYIKKDK